MKSLVRTLVAAATLGVGAWLAAPASAANFAIGVGPGGVNFSLSSGGYCDTHGCPDVFWDMPVYYCPVFYRGDWYRGPVYYRRIPGGVQYWIRGKWRFDEWRGPRPGWACNDRFGPALGFEYYERHGFRMRDEWRTRWRRDHGGPVLRGPDRPGFGPDRHDFDRHDRDRHDNDRHDWDRRGDVRSDHGRPDAFRPVAGPKNDGPKNASPRNDGPKNDGPKKGDRPDNRGGDKGDRHGDGPHPNRP